MTEPHDKATGTTSEYYNSKDADTFYSEVWGGEDIHIGRYRSDDESIFEAKVRTKQTMAVQSMYYNPFWIGSVLIHLARRILIERPLGSMT